jgi:RNA-directed DNA polymerase
MTETKSFFISKKEVLTAYQKVKANKGSYGVDFQNMKDFEKNLKDNLYKIWNRMSSGSYFPPPVLEKEIPKKDGKTRKLGIPTIGDRIAQTVVKQRIEPILEPIFHEDSYGYRPGRSAHDALFKARKRCIKYPWVLDIDIKGFFDNLDHELLLKAIEKHIKTKWILLYIQRWLKAPVMKVNGELVHKNSGTPQGGVISPLLANLFLHYALDKWLDLNLKGIEFERYADDAIYHCVTLKQAKWVKLQIENRLREVKLELHPDKTKIVYCKNVNRKEEYPDVKFDFLGYTFQPRTARNKIGKIFLGFLPAISKQSCKKIRNVIRDLKLPRIISGTLESLSKQLNPKIIGWYNYYGKFYRTKLISIWYYLNNKIISWALNKYKRFRGSWNRAWKWIRNISKRDKNLFYHWNLNCW